ncbi:MAG: TIGR04376 family protein [Xenococcaceae cyanobacterium MO_207.B15]|nr:TIGR04376 family protein [Xenococcaceae cyanobacterium MO_207.B15]MDJ0747416.1 TIGR04376 family protein [Xenococcaceae cyanobacterium MO_167.B27]
MGLFDDINRFLEERLDEFLRNNPHLELQAIEEQLREQEQDTQKLILELQRKETSLQEEIMAIAEKIQTWHSRVSKAEAAKRQDLAEAAKEREAALLRQGNQIWGQMEGTKQRIVQAKQLLQQVQQRRQEVKAKFAEQVTSDRSYSNSYTTGWEKNFSTSSYSNSLDPLEAQFQKWELDDELEQMKRNMGKG